jgi:hypothetical protein
MFLTSVVLLCWAIGECPHSFPFAKYYWNAGLAAAAATTTTT